MHLVLDKSNHKIINRHQPVTRVPYPFQEKAFEALDKLKEKNPKGFSSMLVLPTGAGKTYTAAHWVIKNYIDQGIKVLWIAHRSELLRQAAEAFNSDTTTETLQNRISYETFVVSSEFGRSCNIGKEDVVIAGRQSICSSDNMQYYVKWAKANKLRSNRRLLIVLDEAHHAAARSYREIIKTMRKYIPHVDILGLTATPFRTSKYEQGSLKKIFSTGDGIAYSIDMNTLISAGLLSEPKHIEVSTDVDMTQLFDADQIKKVAKYDLTSLDEKSLEKLNKNSERNNLIVDTYLANRKNFGQTIVFAVDVVNAIALNAIFQSRGIKSDFVISSMISGMNRSASLERNPRIIKDFKDGKLEVLINVNIVTEGTDIPNIKTVFLARPTTSKILMTQMIGRGLRGEAAGGTKETNIVYFIDDWKGLVDFVSPKALLSGDDAIPMNRSNRKSLLMHYIEMSNVAQYAVSGYENRTSLTLNYNNIIPYGVIKCSYLVQDEFGDENDISREIVVFDEGAEIYKSIISEIPGVIDVNTEYSENEIDKIALHLFFKYCEGEKGTYIGVSSEAVSDIIKTYIAYQTLPSINIIEDRVSLYDIVKEVYSPESSKTDIEDTIENIYANNAKVRMWYDKDFYRGMMNVYFNRMKKHTLNAPEVVRLPKEKMDMGEVKKYYPEYYDELRKYLILSMERDEEGYYYSAIQEEGQPPFRSKYLKMFEMDHIVPISKGGLTIKENLQMILRSQNVELGAKDKKQIKK